MKKYYIYLLLVLMLIIPLYNQIKKEDSRIILVDDVKYAVSINGEASNYFPVKGPYTVDVDCKNATVNWDYENWVLNIKNVTGNTYCNISFTSKNKNKINEHVKLLVDTNQGQGQVVNENGYRYEGKNPNNYIKFNGELWRIIGVFDETSHGQKDEYLTKIIKNEFIGGNVWDKNYKNTWTTSSLYNLLNMYYYKASDGTNSGYCYNYSNVVSKSCDYTSEGIKNNYRPMVKNVTWYLGGLNNSATADLFYTYERSNDDSHYYIDNRAYKTVSGYIGLMYVSDYGYSVLSSSCSRDLDLVWYGSAECAGSSWLSIGEEEWFLAHSIDNDTNVYTLANDGHVLNTNSNSGFSVRPTLYLDASVYILNGDGSKANPYIIDM